MEIFMKNCIRITVGIIIFCCLFGCSSTNEKENPPQKTHRILPVRPQNSNTPNSTAINNIDDKNNIISGNSNIQSYEPRNLQNLNSSDEDLELDEENDISLATEDAAVKLHSWLKRGHIIAIQRATLVQLLLQKQPDGKIELVLSEMEDSLDRPTIVKQEISRGILSDTITIEESQFEFWYDVAGSIHWSAEDYTFRPLDPDSKADLVLIPISTKPGQATCRGMLDIVPEKTQVYIHIVSK